MMRNELLKGTDERGEGSFWHFQSYSLLDTNVLAHIAQQNRQVSERNVGLRLFKRIGLYEKEKGLITPNNVEWMGLAENIPLLSVRAVQERCGAVNREVPSLLQILATKQNSQHSGKHTSASY